MKWLSYTLAALLAAATAVSIVGIVADAARLDLWTRLLMWCMLGTVILVPFAVYIGTRNDRTPQSPKKRATRRSPLRTAAYVFSVVAVVWTAISMVSLFVNQANIAFWGYSVLWSLIVLVIWAPIMTFFVNPLQEPRAVVETPDADPVPDFVDASATALPAQPASAIAQTADTSRTPQPASADLVAEVPVGDEPSAEAEGDDSASDDRGWPYV